MIFIQIAAYRDPELLPTIQDCLAKARYKRDLRFGICWQRHENDNTLDAFKRRKSFRIDKHLWHESQGLCWARSRIQKMYEGEDYIMQLDSHHRFVQDWDVKLIESMELTGSAKPIITSYAGVFNPAVPELTDQGPYKMVADRFTPSGTILFRPHIIQGWQDLNKPVRARFVSGHFFFTLGRHCEEYRYDPMLYFAGDEISLSIRSFTLGYDLFHPHRTYLWHEYTRQGRPKHWDDHVADNREKVGSLWHERDKVSKRRLRQMLREEDNGEDISGYGLGDVRTHQEYERYAGINFAMRRLHRETVAGKEPPCTYVDDQQWNSSFLHEHTVELKWTAADIDQCSDHKFVYFGIEDHQGNVLYRYDASAQSEETRGHIQRKSVTFSASTKPAKLIIWPVSHSRGWLNKIVHHL
ncbi:MAG: UDP-N-acetylglucosamine-transferase [Prosthecobacter sp.]|nr:UDP-N-acetylglucosamine-transferase [Prosthecobacter sp.]